MKDVVPAPRVTVLLAAKAIAKTWGEEKIVPIAPEFAPFGLARVMVVAVDATQRNVPLLSAVPKPVAVSTRPA